MANLRGADLTLAHLEGARLEMAVLVDAELWGADAGGADFRSADLRNARCVGARLAGTDLRDVNLSGAWLHNADLRFAQLRRTRLSGARYSEGTRWPAGFDPRSRGAVPAPHWRAPVGRQLHREAQSACERAHREVERSRMLQQMSAALCSHATSLRWRVIAPAYSRPKRGHAALLRLIARCARGPRG